MKKIHLALAALGAAALGLSATPADAGACHAVKVRGEWRCVQAHHPHHHMKRAHRHYHHHHAHRHHRYHVPRHAYAPRYNYAQPQHYAQKQQAYAYAVTTYYYVKQQPAHAPQAYVPPAYAPPAYVQPPVSYAPRYARPYTYVAEPQYPHRAHQYYYAPVKQQYWQHRHKHHHHHDEPIYSKF